MEGTLIKVSYPETWIVSKTATASSLLTVSSPDMAMRLTLRPLMSSPVPLDQPLPQDKLETANTGLKQLIESQTPGVQMVAVGQVMSGGRNWLWFEFDLPLPPSAKFGWLGEYERTLWDGAYLWMFWTTSGQKAVVVSCGWLKPRTLPDAERDERFHQAQAQCGALMGRVSVGYR
jgi:hypothetical protein